MRVYWPGPRKDDDPRQHPLWSRTAIRAIEDKRGISFNDVLFFRLCAAIPIRSLHGHDVLSAPSRPSRFARAELRHDSVQIPRLVAYLQRGAEETSFGGEVVQ